MMEEQAKIAGASKFDRAIEIAFPGWGLRRSIARMGLEYARSYDAAKSGRRTAGWQATGGSANAELSQGLARIRNRARDVVRNNEYAKRATAVYASNVVGYGITITPDNAREAEEWQAWSDSLDCDADDTDNLGGLLRLAVSERFSAGEVLIRRRWRRMSDGYTIPLQLQLLEPDFLDESKIGPIGNSGNYCILGKEYDALGTCVAYWIFPEHPGELAGWSARSFESRRVPASEIIHYRRRDRPSAVRGVSELAVSLMRYRDLADYQDAEMVRKKMEACVVAIISSDKPDKALGMAGNTPGVEKMRPGMISRIGSSESVTFNNPIPSSGGGEFTRHQLHALAVGAGITYAQLTGDMSQANFASNRMGLIEFRQMIEQEQWLTLVPQVLQPIRKWWQEAAALAGVPIGKQAKDKMSMPRKAQVDPLKDTLTAKEAIRGGGYTLSEWLREQGTTLDAYIAERKDELQKLKAAGIVVDTDALVTELGLTGADALQHTADQ
ncbi:MAG: phage portal protein [Rhodoferax sp.]|nr:phage portal protein [Rhodoferax sp.]MDP3650518.1 phage portal protein [Rhodoferax sp.]